MTHQDVIDALHALGFPKGWSVTGTEITFWENDEPQPTEAELKAALK